MDKKFKIIAIACLLIFASKVNAQTTYSGALSTGGLSAGLSGVVVGSPTASLDLTGQNIILTKPSGSKEARYTTDGSTPDCSSSQIYSLPISLGQTETINAISCYADGSSSAVTTFKYVLPTQLPDLIASGAFSLPSDGSTGDSTSAINVAEQVTININSNNVVIPQNTTITAANGQNFSANNLTATTISAGSLNG